MGKLQDFLMEQDVAAQAQVEVTIAPFPFPFVVKSITEAENILPDAGKARVNT